MLLGLAWRNLWRESRRTLLNVSSIAFAVMIMVFLLSFQLGTYATMKENVLRVMDGFAQVQPLGYADDPSLKRTIDDPAPLIGRLEAIDGVTAVAPRAMSFAILSNGEKSFGAAVVGVDPAREPTVSSLHNSVKQGRYLQAQDQAAIVLGSALARNLGVGPGDTVTLLAEARDGGIAADVLTVAGIFETGTQGIDRQYAQIPLSRFQQTFAMGSGINTLALSGPTLQGVTAALALVKQQLAGRPLQVRSWRELQPGMDAAISLDLNTSMMWYVSLVIIVVFIVLNTLLMSVLERTREFGVLLAIGMRPGRIGAMVWLELLLLSAIGLGLGFLIGGAATLLVGHYGVELPGAEAIFSQWGLPGRLYPRLSLLSASAGPGILAVCILLAGIFPWRHVGKLQPVPAMRAA